MTTEKLIENPRFVELLQLVDRELQNLLPNSTERAQGLEDEKRRLEQQRTGWLQSLGNPGLAASIRAVVESEFEASEARIHQIDSELSELRARESCCRIAVDPELVARRLNCLSDTLAGENASATNVLLSQHIDGIYCDSDGRVVVRTCRLGCLAEDLDLVSTTSNNIPISSNPEAAVATGRRRTRRNVGDVFDDENFAADANDFAVDLRRFDGLGPEWFTEDVFLVPERLSWSEEHAEEVARFRLESQATMGATADHFGKTVPTIRKALGYARDRHGLEAFGKAVSQPNRRTWPQQNAVSVAQFFDNPGSTMKAAVEHFGKSEPTIRKARDLGSQMPASG